MLDIIQNVMPIWRRISAAICRQWLRRGKYHFVKNENGFSLIEVTVSLALLGIISVSFLGALANVSRMSLSTEERETASNLAETQMEYVKSQAYFVSYTPAPIPSEYVNYSVLIDTVSLQDSSIQKITITAGREGKIPVRLEGYKVR